MCVYHIAYTHIHREIQTTLYWYVPICMGKMYAKYSLVQYEASANHPSVCIPVSERWIASGKFSQLDPENKPFWVETILGPNACQGRTVNCYWRVRHIHNHWPNWGCSWILPGCDPLEQCQKPACTASTALFMEIPAIPRIGMIPLEIGSKIPNMNNKTTVTKFSEKAI